MISLFLNFVASSSFVALVMALLVGKLTFWISVMSLVSGCLIGGLLYQREEVVFSIWGKGLAALIFIIGSFQFSYILFSVKEVETTVRTLNPNNLGDLPFHINLIRSFASGVDFWPENPLMLGERLKYPFGMDFFNALWEQVGVSLASHLAVVGLVAFLISILALQRWMGAWALVCFFLSGGFSSASELFQGTSWLPGTTVDFKNLFLSVFVTQRGFLYALPAGAWLIHQMNFWQNEVSWKSRLSFILIYGILPFFHLHSFVILSIYLLGHLTYAKKWRLIGTVLAPAWVIALPFVAQALIGGIPNKAMYWSWNWMANDENPFVFWMRNLGTWFALIPALIWMGWKEKENRFPVLWALALFLVFSHWMLAPWAWDQIKILLWCYLFINAEIVKRIFNKMEFKWKAGAAVLLFYAGVFQLYASLPNQISKLSPSVVLFQATDLEFMKPIAREISPNERVLVAPIYNHPIFYFGKQVVMGYPGHIWSQGTDASRLKEQVDLFFTGQNFEISMDWILWTQFEDNFVSESSGLPGFLLGKEPTLELKADQRTFQLFPVSH